MTPTLRSTLVCVGLACALLAAVVGGVAWWYRHPAVNQAQARAVQPVIDAYMHHDGIQLGLGGVLDSRLKPEVFCDANIIEIRTRGPHWRVGMTLGCGECARHGNTLIDAFQGYFDAIADVMPSADGRRVTLLSVDLGPPGYDPAWVHENFSSLAARWLLSTDPPTAPDPVGQARQAFGFPAGYPAVQE